MAGNIKGITIEIGGDVQPLNKALQGVNEKGKDLQAELTLVNKLLKLDPTNVELVSRKQKLLTDAVDNTSKKLDTLKEAEKQAQEQFEKGEISKEQYRALKTEVAETEIQLHRYKGQLEKVGDESKKTATATGDIGKKANDTTPKMRGFSAGSVAAVAAIGAAVAGVIAVIKNLGDKLIDTTKNLAEYGDNISETAAKFKMSTTEYQKWSYVAIATGAEAETVGASFGKLTKSIAKANDGNKDMIKLFKKLGVSIEDDVTGKLRDVDDIFLDVIDGLKNVGDETEADIDANKIFGRSFQDLNPLIAEGSKGLKDLGDKAEEMGLILDESTVNKLADFNDTLDAFKIKSQIVLAPLVEGLIPAFTAVADVVGQKLADPKVQNALKNIGEKIGGFASKITNKFINFLNSDSFDNLANGLVALGDSITEGLTTFITNTLPTLIDNLEWMVENKTELGIIATTLGGIITVLGGATLNPTGLLAGVATFTAGWAMAGDDIQWTLDIIKAKFAEFGYKLEHSVGTWISNITEDIGGFFTGVGDGISGFFLDVEGSILTFLFKAFAKFDEFKENLSGTFATIQLSAIMAWQNISDGFTKIWNGIKDTFTNIWNGIKNVFDGIISGITSGFKGMVNDIIDGLNTIISALDNYLIGNLNKVGINIPYIPKIPHWYAQGGIFNQPTIIGVGEAGPEAVTPINKLQDIIAGTMEQLIATRSATINRPAPIVNIYPQNLSDAQIRRVGDILQSEWGIEFI